ncbi:hypothetical protein BC827DRAFT_1158782 [Russula dissimulans]|nr:hypothetical protein BC827DRAFT_1158782 [Russula dissimulans]
MMRRSFRAGAIAGQRSQLPHGTGKNGFPGRSLRRSAVAAVAVGPSGTTTATAAHVTNETYTDTDIDTVIVIKLKQASAQPQFRDSTRAAGHRGVVGHSHVDGNSFVAAATLDTVEAHARHDAVVPKIRSVWGLRSRSCVCEGGACTARSANTRHPLVVPPARTAPAAVARQVCSVCCHLFIIGTRLRGSRGGRGRPEHPLNCDGLSAGNPYSIRRRCMFLAHLVCSATGSMCVEKQIPAERVTRFPSDKVDQRWIWQLEAFFHMGAACAWHTKSVLWGKERANRLRFSPFPPPHSTSTSNRRDQGCIFAYSLCVVLVVVILVCSAPTHHYDIVGLIAHRLPSRAEKEHWQGRTGNLAIHIDVTLKWDRFDKHTYSTFRRSPVTSEENEFVWFGRRMMRMMIDCWEAGGGGGVSVGMAVQKKDACLYTWGSPKAIRSLRVPGAGRGTT